MKTLEWIALTMVNLMVHDAAIGAGKTFQTAEPVIQGWAYACAH
jgi:hypothetical protein